MSTGRGATPLRIAIIGASGSAGEQLIGCLLEHSHVQLTELSTFVVYEMPFWYSRSAVWSMFLFVDTP